MTSLLFYTASDEAMVVMDSLVANREGETLRHIRKASPYPGARLIIAGTGLEELFLRWTRLVNEEGSTFDVDVIDAHTPQILKGLWADIEREVISLVDHTATIYQFGFSREDGTIHGFKYHSEDGFASQPLAYGLGIKPQLADSQGIDFSSFPRCAIQIMEAQMLQEHSSPTSTLKIGGEVWVWHLTREGITEWKLGELDQA